MCMHNALCMHMHISPLSGRLYVTLLKSYSRFSKWWVEARWRQAETKQKTVSKVVASCAPGFPVPWIWRVHSKFWPKFGCTKITRKVFKKNDPVPSKLARLQTLFLEPWKGYLSPCFIPSVSPHISLQITKSVRSQRLTVSCPSADKNNN